jgi:TolA-binding protein
MTRFFCFPLLFVLALSVFAQEDPTQLGQPQLGQPLLRDPRLLAQERDRITYELQQIQRLIGVISPDDVQTMNTLKSQQADLVKQLRDITQQTQAGQQIPGMSSNIAEVLPGQIPTSVGRAGMNVPPGTELPPELRNGGGYNPYTPPQTSMLPNPSAMPMPMPNPPMPMYNPMPTYNPIPSAPQPWNNPDRAWESVQWGPRLPQELTEVKQSVESLQKEIADLKETVKSLETQIQLLTRNILLSERTKENGN